MLPHFFVLEVEPGVGKIRSDLKKSMLCGVYRPCEAGKSKTC
jgi:hypothetical protein